jgi:hypothetical protein
MLLSNLICYDCEPSFLGPILSYDPSVVWMEYVWLPFLELQLLLV